MELRRGSKNCGWENELRKMHEIEKLGDRGIYIYIYIYRERER